MVNSESLIIFNVVVCSIILGMMIFVGGYTVRVSKRARRYLTSFVDTFLPKLKPRRYHEISWPEVSDQNSLLVFLTGCLMTCYNVSFNLKPQLPPNVTLISKLGQLGLVLRRGEGQYIICFRGTIEGKDILTDLDTFQVPFVDLSGQSHQELLVHRGFHSLWQNLPKSLLKLFRDQDCLFVGHSLGGCLAQLAAVGVYLWTNKLPRVVTFGSPKLGNQSLVDLVPTTAIVNETDPIPQLPPSVFKIMDTPCFYASVSNKILIDVQTGDNFGNHSLVTYSYGLANQFISQETIEILFNRRKIGVA